MWCRRRQARRTATPPGHVVAVVALAALMAASTAAPTSGLADGEAGVYLRNESVLVFESASSSTSMSSVYVNGVDVPGQLRLLRSDFVSDLSSRQAAALQRTRAASCLFPTPRISFAANTILRFAYFEIGGIDYIAACVHLPLLQYADSKVARYDVRSRTLHPHQTIKTTACRSVEYFSFDGDHYLVFANQELGSNSVVDSSVHKWDPLTEAFVSFQNITTTAALDVEYFTLFGTHHYLIFAEPSVSYLYEMEAGGTQFERVSSFSTNMARDWTSFSVYPDRHFLAVANAASSHSAAVRVYELPDVASIADGTVAATYSLPGVNPYTVEAFNISGDVYVAVGNYGNQASNHVLDSTIHKFDPVDNSFSLVQSIRTYGVYDWEFFTIDDTDYLVAVSNYANSRTLLDSVVYSWDQAERQFKEFQTILTNSATRATFFTATDGSHHLAFAFGGGNQVSFIYRWNGCHFVEADDA